MKQDQQLQELSVSSVSKQAYIDYAVSTITSRSLPDIRDGLKNVHRRLIYASYGLGARSTASKVKSSRIVGETCGRYHPYGDAATYNALVRMAQTFISPLPLINGEGNFGSQKDPDSFAAQRYTEARLGKITDYLLSDININNVVNFKPNYDNKDTEPEVLPASIPYFLLGSNVGIAVGFVTNALPYHAGELMEASKLIIQDPTISYDELWKVCKGVDVPTGCSTSPKLARSIMENGSGVLPLRAPYRVENDTTLVFYEFPYLTSLNSIIDSIVTAASPDEKTKREAMIPEITGIKEIKNTIILTLKKGSDITSVVNKLYKNTLLHKPVTVGYTAVVDGVPKEQISLKEAVLTWYKFRQQCIINKYTTLSEDIKTKLYFYNGFLKVLVDPELAIKLIRTAKNKATIISKLVSTFGITEAQAEYVLNLKVIKFSKEEIEGIKAEIDELNKKLAGYQAIIKSKAKIDAIIIADLDNFKAKFGKSPRLLKLDNALDELNEDDRVLIPEETCSVFLSYQGYMKRISAEAMTTQKRGGKGRNVKLRKDDFIKSVYTVNSHDNMIAISNLGKAYHLPAYQIPACKVDELGKHAGAILNLSEGETINTLLPIPAYDDRYNIITLTRQGYIKRVSCSEYANIRSTGILAVKLQTNDEVIAAELIEVSKLEQSRVIVAMHDGTIASFNADQIPLLGRVTIGLGTCRKKNMKIALYITDINSEDEIVLLTSNGLGKRVKTKLFPNYKRNNMGVKGLDLHPNTTLVGMLGIQDTEGQIIAVSNNKTIKFDIASVPSLLRPAKGCRVMNLNEDEAVLTFGLIM